jgi:hypothetical protein
VISEEANEPKLRHDPPEIPGYELRIREAIPLNRLSLWAVLSGIPWAIFFFVIGLMIQQPEDLAFTISLLTIVLVFVVLLIVVPILHEAIHGIVALTVGAKPFYGVGAGYAYTSFREPISPRQYIVISIAPLLTLSIASIAAFALIPGWFLYILVLATGNAAGSLGDLWILNRVRTLPTDAIIYDLADGYAAFVPIDPELQR